MEINMTSVLNLTVAAAPIRYGWPRWAAFLGLNALEGYSLMIGVMVFKRATPTIDGVHKRWKVLFASLLYALELAQAFLFVGVKFSSELVILVFFQEVRRPRFPRV